MEVCKGSGFLTCENKVDTKNNKRFLKSRNLCDKFDLNLTEELCKDCLMGKAASHIINCERCRAFTFGEETTVCEPQGILNYKTLEMAYPVLTMLQDTFMKK